jgi:hypothetical protein
MIAPSIGSTLGLRLTPRDRRAIGLGVLVIAATLLVSRGLPAWRARRRGAERSARATTAALTRDEALLRQRRILADTLAAREARLRALNAMLFRGESRAAATAALGGQVSRAASAAGVTLGAVALTSDSAAALGLRRIRAQGEATGDIQGIARFLAALDLGPHRLALVTLRITQSDPAAPDDHVEALALSFTIEGLMRADTTWQPR